MKQQIIAIGVIAAIAMLALFLVQNQNGYLYSQNGLTTVRLWNQCQENAGIACESCPKKEHTICFNSLIETNNCMFRDADICLKTFEFIYNPDNVDKVLPDIFTQCVSICDQYAQGEKHFYQWYSQKFYTCSQA